MRFEKVPFEEYKRAYEDAMGIDCDPALEELLKLDWEHITLPVRATTGSAGYDFYLPCDSLFKPDCQTIVPTGIRAQIDSGFLMLLPRSGLGFKYGMRLVNTCGIVDQDYYFADNYGHIMAKIAVDEEVMLEQGTRFMQGILVPFNIVDNDAPLKELRVGGFGSTGM
jgi:dUTP pyrophosphatase